MPRKPKKRLLIDIRIPNADGFRMTVKAVEGEVTDEVLAKWVPVCEQLMKIATAHFGRAPDGHTEGLTDG